MEELADKKVSSTIITGTYQAFNQPQVFQELLKIPNLKVLIAPGPLHAKGYLFDHGDYQTAIVGSANFTRSALLANQEWCLKVDSETNSSLVNQLKAEFADLQKDAAPLTPAWLADYKANWVPAPKVDLRVTRETQKIIPNAMQTEALASLDQLLNNGAKKALVVSATGTGKTYLAAFAVKAYQPKRFLYLVHREEIARKALESFYRVIGGDKNDFALFDYNLAYEIRLPDALRNNMLTPFHYIGIRDYEVDGEVIDDTSQLSQLASSDWVRYILKEMDYYGYDGDRPCGLVFCSRQDEAKELAQEFTKLGRGLRLFPGQDFVTVLDFIGNYQNNYLIPLALSGKRVSRDQLKYQLRTVSFAELSTINFSQIAAEEILHSLDQVKLDSLKELREAYKEKKKQLGRTPLLYDYRDKYSPLLWIENGRLPHYGAFLSKMDEKVTLSSLESKILSFVTKELAPGQRQHELLLLKALLASKAGSISDSDFRRLLRDHGCYDSAELEESVEKVLSLDFFDVKVGKTTQKEKYGNTSLVSHETSWILSPALASGSPDFKKLVSDAIQTGLYLARDTSPQDQFALYHYYDRKDVCRLLNWPLNVSRPMYGYRLSGDVCPIFITHKKEDTEQRNSRYDNQASGQVLTWYTRSPRHLTSPEVVGLLRGVENGAQVTKLPIFVKRSDAYGKRFCYLGLAKIVPDSVAEVTLKGKSTVEMDLQLITPLLAEQFEQLFED